MNSCGIVRVCVSVCASVCMRVDGSVHVRKYCMDEQSVREREKAGCWWLLIVVVSCVYDSGARAHYLELVYQHAYALPLEIRENLRCRAYAHIATRLPRFFHELYQLFDHTHTHTDMLSHFLPSQFRCLLRKFVLFRSFPFLRFRQ